jgi:NADH:ubiquinone oxidoreductase subunit E
MVVTICIGSSCHLKGSRKIVEKFNELIQEKGVSDKVSLNGSFCIGECEKGVCIKVDDKLHSVLPESAEAFFEKEIMAKL